MPIKDKMKPFYPSNWKKISKRLRSYAGYKCQWCRRPNGLCLIAQEDGAWHHLGKSYPEVNHDELLIDFEMRPSMREQTTPKVARLSPEELEELIANHKRGKRAKRSDEYRISKSVVTVAHLDQDPTNNSYPNLKVLCNACHLGYDSSDEQALRRALVERRLLEGKR